jgi:hypothetical protein
LGKWKLENEKDKVRLPSEWRAGKHVAIEHRVEGFLFVPNSDCATIAREQAARVHMSSSQITGAERRRSVRKRARKVIQLTWRNSQAERQTSTSTTSVSRFGCAVLGHEALRAGEEVRVEYEGKVMLGSVCYVMRNATSGEIEVGIAFNDDAEEFWAESF